MLLHVSRPLFSFSRPRVPIFCEDRNVKLRPARYGTVGSVAVEEARRANRSRVTRIMSIHIVEGSGW